MPTSNHPGPNTCEMKHPVKQTSHPYKFFLEIVTTSKIMNQPVKKMQKNALQQFPKLADQACSTITAATHKDIVQSEIQRSMFWPKVLSKLFSCHQ